MRAGERSSEAAGCGRSSVGSSGVQDVRGQRSAKQTQRQKRAERRTR
jgi:hypothetical protein